MSMRAFLSGCIIAASLCAAAIAAPSADSPWRHPLSYDGGGYWPLRITISVDNKSAAPLEGAPGRLVIEPDGPTAWPPREDFHVGVANPGFETGDVAPAAWSAHDTGPEHRMSLDSTVARSGDRSARCEVTPGAPARWVKYAQGGIAVSAGARYRFSAWVKAENVEGKAGWFVHVDGARPQMVNRVEGWNGSFDWREIVIEFTVPEGGATFLCGTVLHGTGVAWFDDARLERLDDDGAPYTLAVEAVDEMRLADASADAPWPDNPALRLRAPITVRNFSDTAVERGIFSVDVRRLANSAFKQVGPVEERFIRVLESDGAPVDCAGSFEGDLKVVTTVPPRSEKTVWLYLGARRPGGEALRPSELAAWSRTPWNLLENGSMEDGDGAAPAAWESGEEGRGDGGRFRAQRVAGGIDGDWCLQLDVPDTGEQPGWIGWRQRVDVKPNTKYLLAGFLKTRLSEGEARIHGHFHRADGQHTDQAFFGTGPGLRGETDWTLSSVAFATPADCAYLVAHLTMNARGTLWHDAILLAEMGEGVSGVFEARAPQPEPLDVWAVNPLVKTFRHDLPPPGAPRDVDMHAARNTSESFQLAVRYAGDAALEVDATPFAGPGGARLDAPAVYRVGFVPIDFPMGYSSTTAPRHHRLLPSSRGNDGWPDLWPDPLETVDGPVALASGMTQPLWFDVRVPEDAAPGEYRGEVRLRAGAHTAAVPVRLTVWNFTSPAAKRLPALLDLRFGPSGTRQPAVERDTLYRRWARFLADYHVSPALVIYDPEFSLEDGRVRMDTTEFDAFVGYLFDELGVNKLYTPWIFYACGWAYEPRDFLGFKAFTPEYVRAWTEGYTLFVDHITEKGWRDRFVHYLSDEPFANSEKTITGLARVADMARAVAPDIPVYSSTWHPIAGLEGHVNLWGAGPHGSFSLEKIDERRAAGDRFWFTTDGHMCTDTPFLGVERILPWLCFKYGVEAYEFWGVSWWTYDPWEAGWHDHIRQSDQGEHFYYVRYPNGDGFLAYPPRDATNPDAQPVPSIRLMAVRDGVNDFELFRALETLAQQGDAEARAALDAVRDTVSMVAAGGRHSTAFMPDPDAVQRARARAGEVLSRRGR